MRHYFKPVEYSITHLYISNNRLRNLTQGVFGNMPHLQWLDLTHNKLTEMDFDCFKNTKNLQVLFLSSNEITDIPAEALRPLKKLRIVDLSHNRLRTLPDNVFTDSNMESLDLSHNQFTRLPMKSMSASSAMSLANLDMSWNILSGIHNIDTIFRLRVSSQSSHASLSLQNPSYHSIKLILTAKYFLFSTQQGLVWLDLSYNRLVRLDENVFSDLPHLAHLDLSHNKQLILEPRGRTFYGLEDTLLSLSLSNISLLSVSLCFISKENAQSIKLIIDNVGSRTVFETIAELVPGAQRASVDTRGDVLEFNVSSLSRPEF